MTRFLPLILTSIAGLASTASAAEPVTMPENLLLAPTPANPRNSEGDFIALKDGRVLFVYTHFTTGASDYAEAHLASRVSSDGGQTWSSEDRVVVAHEGGHNVMSVSLLRLQNGAIALLYLRKVDFDNCLPQLRISTDEGETWSEPTACITEPAGYYVVNNDRMVQLKSGRLVIPAARHVLKGEEKFQPGKALCVLSDDNGKTWRMSQSLLEAPTEISSGLQEPLVLEMKDGRLLMICRTNGGAQYRSFSADGGDTWSAVERTNLLSPTSPATVERIPGGDDLLLVWNDHTGISEELKDKRTPLRAALSQDDGKTWRVVKTLEDNPAGWYCYTAMDFAEGHALLGYCAGIRGKENNGLQTTKVTRLKLEDLYTNLENAPVIQEEF
ncbi:MAG: exo-alpha-sialidase [Candidatus Hydrogenedentes bacterium]|nr:exo-alpha-sialidase [Candidatus Hydrogenedentota bacterium]